MLEKLDVCAFFTKVSGECVMDESGKNPYVLSQGFSFILPSFRCEASWIALIRKVRIYNNFYIKIWGRSYLSVLPQISRSLFTWCLVESGRCEYVPKVLGT